jgi:hypothetical protein
VPELPRSQQLLFEARTKRLDRVRRRLWTGAGDGRTGLVAPIGQGRIRGGVQQPAIVMQEGGGGGGAPVIDLGDGAVLTGWSKSWRFFSPTTMTSVLAGLEAPGSTNTVLWITKNGADQVQVTIPATELFVSQNVTVSFEAGDRWQVRVGQAGTGAIGLSVFAGVG